MHHACYCIADHDNNNLQKTPLHVAYAIQNMNSLQKEKNYLATF